MQRVTEASVTIEGTTTAQIGRGMLVLVGVRRSDTESQALKLVEKLLSYRFFSDADGKMNLDIRDVKGELLLVPQFTLAADTSKGRRPGFSTAASPEDANRLFQCVCAEAANVFETVQFGRFGVDMQVALINDGPVTFWLEV